MGASAAMPARRLLRDEGACFSHACCDSVPRHEKLLVLEGGGKERRVGYFEKVLARSRVKGIILDAVIWGSCSTAFAAQERSNAS
eukprot:8327273-Pyramimonas_sp.AAC.1